MAPAHRVSYGGSVLLWMSYCYNDSYERKAPMSHWRERLGGVLKDTRFLRIIAPLLRIVVLATFLAINASASAMPTT